jgi:hemolysin activation/secretion protein
MTNDDPDEFRGYKDNRFRDRGITALSVEYRWAVWANRQPGEAGLDGYIATDLGQVFNRYAEINRRNVTVSYVVGLRGVRASGFAWRAEIGWSKDEVRLQLTSDQIFQAIGENLFRGREEVALR